MQNGIKIGYVQGIVQEIRRAVMFDRDLPLAITRAKFNHQTLRYQYFDKEKYKKFNLSNCPLISRIVALLIQLKQILSENIIATKRSLYYTLIQYYHDGYHLIDLDLRLICHSLQCSRISLNIIGSSKCEIGGNIIVDGQMLKGRRVITGNEVIQFKDNSIIIILQKQTIFHILFQQYQQYVDLPVVLVTAKGYPDHSVHHLLSVMKLNKRLKFFYLGDFDPFGFDILCQYAFSNDGNVYENFGVGQLNWIYAQRIILQNISEMTCLQFSKLDWQRIKILFNRQYFRGEYLKNRKLVRWKQRISQFCNSGTKVQLQSLLQYLKTSFFQTILMLIQNGHYN